MPDDSDLEYDGRARRRPPGANSTVIDIFDLLEEHPEGLTVADLWDALRTGFPTDAYRAYEHRLKTQRAIRSVRADRGRSDTPTLPPPQLVFGSPEFKVHAENWWIRRALISMQNFGTAQLRDDRWYRGHRPPNVHIVCEAGKRHAVPYDSKKGRAEDAARVRRAHLREEAREVLADKRLSSKARKVIEALLELT